MKFKFAKYIAIITVTFIGVVIYFFAGVVRPGLKRFVNTNDTVDALYVLHGSLVEYRLNLTQLFNQSAKDKDLLEKQIVVLEKLKTARADTSNQIENLSVDNYMLIQSVGEENIYKIDSVFSKISEVISDQEAVLKEFDDFSTVFTRLYEFDSQKIVSIENNEQMLSELMHMSEDILQTLTLIESATFSDQINVSMYTIQLGDLQKRVDSLIEELREDQTILLEKQEEIRYIADKHSELKLAAFEDNLTIMRTLRFVESLKDLSNKMLELKDVIHDIEMEKDKFIISLN